MSVAEVFSIIGVVIIGLGLILTLVRNGRSQSRSMGKLEGTLVTSIGNINNRLDDPNNGLSAIKGAVDEQAVHCARVSTGLATKVEALEKKRRK